MVAVTMVTETKTNLALKCVVILFEFFNIIENSIQNYEFQDHQSCTENEFYDIFYFKCVPCGLWESEFQTDLQTYDLENNMCVCKKNFTEISRLDDVRLSCDHCKESNQATIDQLGCAKCLNGCDFKCMGDKILVYRGLNGTINQRKCETCAPGTRCEPCLYDPLNSSQLICLPCPPDYQLIENECFQSSKLISDSAQHLFKLKYDNGKEVESKLLHEKLPQVAYKCQYYNSPQACSALLNLCVLQLFDNENSNGACQIYIETRKKNLDDEKNKHAERYMMPSISESESSVLTKTDITTKFSFGQNSNLPLKLARYDLDGRLLSIENATPSALQISPTYCSNSFAFGSWCNKTYYIKASFLWQFKSGEFYELFIEYSEDDKNKLFPILVKNLNSKMKEPKNDHQLTRRFFLVDNLSGIQVDSKNKKSEVVRYANFINLQIQLQDDDLGNIFPPLLTIGYKEVRLDECEKTIEGSFKISYWMNQDKVNDDITVALSVFSVLAVILSALNTWSWSKHSGRIAIDLYALMKMIFYLCGNLSNAFLLVFYLVSLIRLVFYKEQRGPYLIAPTKDQEQHFYYYLTAAFCLKCIDLLHYFFVYTNIDIFFIDWERPRLSGQGDATQNTVSVWRNYYIAKEWKKLLTFRKTNTALNLLILLFFLKVLKIEELALLKHNSTPTNECEPFSQTFRFALVVSFYFLAALIQTAYFRLIRDTFLGDKITRFLDLCSICNVSVFILAFNQYGYYIHGRSVHGHADTDMKQFNEHLKREEDNLCSQRGLVPNSSLQCFSVFITKEFRQQFNKIHLPAITDVNFMSSRSQLLPEVAHTFSKLGSLSEQFILSYQTMNKFLSAFIDHALQDLDYIVKNKLTTEKILNIEFQEPTDTSFFYNDPANSFTFISFYGHELDFLVWEILLVSLVDIMTGDFFLSVMITIVCYKIFEKIYQNKAKWNTANKSLLDRRFLI